MTPQVTPQVDGGIGERILRFCSQPRSLAEIAEELGYSDRKTVRKHMRPLLEQGRLAMTIPHAPRSQYQKYVTVR